MPKLVAFMISITLSADTLATLSGKVSNCSVLLAKSFLQLLQCNPPLLIKFFFNNKTNAANILEFPSSPKFLPCRLRIFTISEMLLSLRNFTFQFHLKLRESFEKAINYHSKRVTTTEKKR